MYRLSREEYQIKVNFNLTIINYFSMYTLNQRAFKFILMTQGRRKQRKARWAKMKLVYYAPRLSWSKPGWAASARAHPLSAPLVTHIFSYLCYLFHLINVEDWLVEPFNKSKPVSSCLSDGSWTDILDQPESERLFKSSPQKRQEKKIWLWTRISSQKLI